MRSHHSLAWALSVLSVVPRTSSGWISIRYRAGTTSPRFVSSSSNNNDDKNNELAQDAVASLAKRGKTWQRLGPMVTLTTAASSGSSVADIGCDHGLLAWGLTLTGRFDRVYGVDVSKQALQQGALVLLERKQQSILNGTKLKFLEGNGLEPLEATVDAICIAGMGAGTMKHILDLKHLDRIGCQRVVVQPTNSRPRNLMMLYHHLAHACGFITRQEHIEYLSKRWYISTSFQRQEHMVDVGSPTDQLLLPGQTFKAHKDPEQRRIYKNYVAHHIKWLERDEQLKGMVDDPNDRLWLDTIRSTQ